MKKTEEELDNIDETAKNIAHNRGLVRAWNRLRATIERTEKKKKKEKEKQSEGNA